jgi:GT2 family glycosyltransferase
MSEKIGLGIVTFNRENGLKKAFNFPHEFVDELVIINDGKPIDELYFRDNFNGKSLRFIDSNGDGVGKAKNVALLRLINSDCDHFFLMEDDIFIKPHMGSVFQKYIEASKATGIQHFNFSQHGIMNKTFDGLSTPNPRMIVKYGDIQVPLYPHCVGAFSYFSRKCLETVGLMDEEYYNACEHMDHTLEIIKAGMHPPFWYFADIENSWEYLGDEPWSLQQSTISSKPDHSEVMRAADQVFFKKHGHYPLQTPLTSEEGVVKSLKEIKKNYGK